MKDLFAFVEEMVQKDSDFFMVSQDVDSVLTNLPLHETIDICTNALFKSREKVRVSKIEFKELFSLATKKSYFIYNRELYKQVDGVAMDSPLGPMLANVFLAHFEKTCLQNFPSDVWAHYYWRYVDHIFVLFTSPIHLEDFRDFLHAPRANKFTIEMGKQNRMSFLDVQIIREDKTFTTSVYRKLTFSRVYTHFDSFLPPTYKFGTVYTLAHRCL